ncbi:MAG: PD-(D/E)XK nuclease family protein [Thermodesulfobacteriota bacterium]
MADFKNEFSWSYSRDNLFQECRREYYYNYYGSWGGWDIERADSLTRTLYVLKNLQNRWQWKGSAVHDEIERILKELVSTGNLTPLERSIDRVTKILRDGFRSSRDKKYWNKSGSLRFEPALYEHEYRPETPDEIWKRTYDEVILCLENFYKSSVPQEVSNLPKEVVCSIESMTGSYFSFNSELYYVKLDLAYSIDDEIKIYDWKTGSGEADQLQFLVYALYAHEELDFDLNKISVTELNLFEDYTKIHTFDEDQINYAREYISESIDNMKRNLNNPQENEAIMLDFPRTQDTKTCELCKFQKICFDLD